MTLTEDGRRRLVLSKLAENNPNWKGDTPINYSSLHSWIRNRLSKPKTCPLCNLEKKIELCNISGKYLRDLKDWEHLCRKCHFKKYGHGKHMIGNKLHLLSKPRSSESRSIAAKKGYVNMTFEERSEKGRNSWVTRRKNLEIH